MATDNYWSLMIQAHLRDFYQKVTTIEELSNKRDVLISLNHGKQEVNKRELEVLCNLFLVEDYCISLSPKIKTNPRLLIYLFGVKKITP